MIEVQNLGNCSKFMQCLNRPHFFIILESLVTTGVEKEIF